MSRTGRVLLVQEAPKFAGFMAEVAATIAESEVSATCGADPPALRPDTLIPYSPTLEKASVPQVDDIVREAAALVGSGEMPRIPLLMPKMSMTMEFGTVEQWLVEVGGARERWRRRGGGDHRQGRHGRQSTCDGTAGRDPCPVGRPGAGPASRSPTSRPRRDDLLRPSLRPAADKGASTGSTNGAGEDSVAPDAVSDEPRTLPNRPGPDPPG